MKSESDFLIYSSRGRKKGSSVYCLHSLENELADQLKAEIYSQPSILTRLTRHFDTFFRGGKASFSFLSDEQLKSIQSFTTTISRLIYRNKDSNSINPPVPSKARRKIEDFSTVFLPLAQVGEIPASMDTFNYENKTLVLYILDAWEPKLPRLFKIIKNYDIDVVFCQPRKAAEYLRAEGYESAYWLPIGFDETVYKDYGMEKDYLVIQFGRKHPKLHNFFRNYCGSDDYIYHFIKGVAKLAKHINRSKFFAVSPRNLTHPKVTGNMSTVTPRYFQGIACNSLPVGFKPTSKEYDLLFGDKVYMIEFENEKKFKRKLEYFAENKDEYEKILSRNYSHLHQNHKWSDRIDRIKKVLHQESIL